MVAKHVRYAEITPLEILAAFRCSKLIAEREGFERKADEVSEYVGILEEAESHGCTFRIEIVKEEV